MSGESPKKIGRGFARDLEAGQLQPMIDSWDLHLRADKKSAKTIRTYLEAAQWLAAGYLVPAGLAGWDEVKARHVQEWIITLLGRYSDCYANNQFRALQQFFRWHATEDPDEPRANPMASLKPPKIGDKLIPVFTDDELALLLGTCKGGGSRTAATTPSSRCSRTPAPGCPNWPGSRSATSHLATARPSSLARATSSGRSGSPTKLPARSSRRRQALRGELAHHAVDVLRRHLPRRAPARVQEPLQRPAPDNDRQLAEPRATWDASNALRHSSWKAAGSGDTPAAFATAPPATTRSPPRSTRVAPP
jgi:hypothetical protein